MLNRRKLLTAGGILAGGIALSAPAVLKGSGAGLSPLPPRPPLDGDQAIFVEAGDATAEAYAAAYNIRTTLTPRLRALCKTPGAVAAMVDWARTHDLSFALRCGGHSFEGLSQSGHLVIDTRLLNRIDFDRVSGLATVGAGTLVSDIYAVLGKEDHAVPASYCQSVGIAGLTLGGGLGSLSRSIGLTCDTLQELEIVDAEGRLLTVNARSNPDLFWACRGGGGGSFGVATSFRFATQAVPLVVSAVTEWDLPPGDAVDLLVAWQSWLPNAPDEIASVLFLWRKHDRIFIRLVGTSIGSEAQLRSEIAKLTAQASPVAAPGIEVRSFVQHANAVFSPGPPPGWFRYKSEIISAPLPDEMLRTFCAELGRAPEGVLVICEALGGAANRVPVNATAFPHRQALFGIQCLISYKSWWQWRKASHSLAALYRAVRAAGSGAYVNYSDLELDDWPRAYWGSNLERLQTIKRRYDPGNVFRHPQSVSPA